MTVFRSVYLPGKSSKWFITASDRYHQLISIWLFFITLLFVFRSSCCFNQYGDGLRYDRNRNRWHYYIISFNNIIHQLKSYIVFFFHRWSPSRGFEFLRTKIPETSDQHARRRHAAQYSHFIPFFIDLHSQLSFIELDLINTLTLIKLKVDNSV